MDKKIYDELVEAIREQIFKAEIALGREVDLDDDGNIKEVVLGKDKEIKNG